MFVSVSSITFLYRKLHEEPKYNQKLAWRAQTKKKKKAVI